MEAKSILTQSDSFWC